MNPVGLHTTTILGLERLLLESPAFLSWTNSPNYWTARKRIKQFSFAEDPQLMQGARPFALCLSAEQASLMAVGFGQSTDFWPEAQAALLLTDVDRTPDLDPRADRREDYLRFSGHCDRILADLRELAGVDDRLPIHRTSTAWPITHSPTRDDPSAGAYWHAAFLISWGGRS